MKNKKIELKEMSYSAKYNFIVDTEKIDIKILKSELHNFIADVFSKNMIISEENEAEQMHYIFKGIGITFKLHAIPITYENDFVELIKNINSTDEGKCMLFETMLGSFIQKININFQNFESDDSFERELWNKLTLKYNTKKKFGKMTLDFYEPSIDPNNQINIQRKKMTIIFYSAYDLQLLLEVIKNA